MPDTDHDAAMNQFIRAARGQPLDLTSPAAINRAIRERAGRQATEPLAQLPAPPGPDQEPAAMRRWADQAAEAGMDSHQVAAWVGHWVQAHHQHLNDRRADR
jgi:hypothetical protein